MACRSVVTARRWYRWRGSTPVGGPREGSSALTPTLSPCPLVLITTTQGVVRSGVPGEPCVLSSCGTHVPGLWLRRGVSDGQQTLLCFPKHHPEATSIPRIPPETWVPSGSPGAISGIWGPPSWRHTPLPRTRAGIGWALMTRRSSSVQTSKDKTTDARVWRRGHSVPHGHGLLPEPMPFLSTWCRGPASDRPHCTDTTGT